MKLEIKFLLVVGTIASLALSTVATAGPAVGSSVQLQRVETLNFDATVNPESGAVRYCLSSGEMEIDFVATPASCTEVRQVNKRVDTAIKVKCLEVKDPAGSALDFLDECGIPGIRC